MKSSQVMARIEAAGWKRIRSEGSHFTYERDGKRVLYGYGRPHTEIGKRRLAEIETRFHLREIERDKEALRKTVTQPPAPVRVRTTNGIEMSDQTARLLYAQLHRDHQVTLTRVSKMLDIPHGDLTNYLHREENLKSSDKAAFWAWLGEQEKKFGLTRNREELREKGWGARTGAQNSRDPFVDLAREALLVGLQGGNRQIDLAQTIGIAPSVISGILSHKSKTIYPASKQKLQQWMTDNEMVPVQENFLGEIKLEPEVILPARPATPIDTDPEMIAMGAVWEAVRGLKGPAARRILTWAADRIAD